MKASTTDNRGPAAGPAAPPGGQTPAWRLAVVGSPNVGKSVLFTRLTGTYATAANYPGTTVEVTRGTCRLGDRVCQVQDTPGMYSLFPVSEEEHVARQILVNENPDLVVQVADARNLRRMLCLTLELLDAGFRLVLVVNMIDEARAAGLRIDVHQLAWRLGIPVVATASTTGEGFPALLRVLRETLADPAPQKTVQPHLPPPLAARRDEVEALLRGSYPVNRRHLALHLLAGDEDALALVLGREDAATGHAVRAHLAAAGAETIHADFEAAAAHHEQAGAMVAAVVSGGTARAHWQEELGRALMRPTTGLPILFIVLYWGIYRFVGGFGAGTVVGWMDEVVFQAHLTPWLTQAVPHVVPWLAMQDLLVGESGVLTLGLRYALAVVMPIVALFFLFFAVVEDCGYLPRLALLVDRTFKGIGLSGRAVIPLVLGFGCATMATLVTRTLPTARERILATFLLALAIPCSAQLGVILAVLHGHTTAIVLWAGVLAGVFLVVGYAGARLLPGEGPSFYMELPPLRRPQAANVLVKTWVRLKWYLLEIIPFFMLASALVWLGKLTGALRGLTDLLAGPVALIGLPPETATVFILGFFRRDYGAAGLLDLHKAGALNANQVLIACVALTLFLPCFAQLLINIKERGWRAGVAISTLVLVLSFGVSWLVNQFLSVSALRL